MKTDSENWGMGFLECTDSILKKKKTILSLLLYLEIVKNYLFSDVELSLVRLSFPIIC